MKRYILAAIASIVVGSASAADAPEVKGHGQPLSVLVVRACGSIVAAYATWPDGTVVAADARHQIPLPLLDSLLKTAKDSKILDMDCNERLEQQGVF